jgi:hypothetical protein
MTPMNPQIESNDSDIDALATPPRHPDYYIEDGNLVLLVSPYFEQDLYSL